MFIGERRSKLGRRMVRKLFDDCDDEDISMIEIDKDFARRYEHNKKREDMHRLQELERKNGPISRSRGGSDSQESESSSSDEEDDDDSNEIMASGKDLEFFDALIKVRDKDPVIKEKDIILFQSDDDGCEGEEEGKETTKQKKKKTYLKDVVAKQVIEEGPDFDDDDDVAAHEGYNKKSKSYNEEQEELKQAFLKAASDGEDDGEFMKVKKKDDVDDDTTTATDDELKKKLDEYFGKEESLDENNKFLMDFFSKKMWVDKDKKNKDLIDDNEIDELYMDEEEIEKQEDYETSFRHEEEDLGDRVWGHSRIVDESVRKKDNTRKEQRQRKEERMKIAEMERKEELKHLKNLKKEEMKEKLDKIKKIAGIGEEEDCPLDEDELLDDEFDPEEHDRMMKVVFGDKYYHAEDVDPEFGSDDDEDIEKPNFEKEDELLGLPKGAWDDPESRDDGFFAARERSLKHKVADIDDDNVSDIDAGDDGNGTSDDNDDGEKSGGGGDGGAAATPDEDELGKKRKRKKKLSLMKRAKEALMEEYYKLDYEDTIGDLKTRFKYAKTKPNRYGLKSGEILMMDEKDLNQCVPLKKIAPYREKEWKVPNNQRRQFKEKVKEQFYGGKSKKRKRREEEEEGAASTKTHTTTEQQEEEAPNGKQAAKGRRRPGLNLPKSRLFAYGKIPTSSKSKSKTKH